MFRIDTLKIETIRDSLVIDSTLKPEKEIIYKYITITDSDTVYIYDSIKEIIYKYFAINVYKDTILDNTEGLIIITDSIYKNIIKSRKSDISIYSLTAFESPKVNHFFVGAGFAVYDTIYFKVNLDFQHKKHMFGIEGNTKKEVLFNYKYMIY